MSTLCRFLRSSTRNFTTAASKSSPPRRVSPPVAFTSKMPPSIRSTDTSKVPPPKSKMSTFAPSVAPFSPVLSSSPYAIAAAVGSLMTRTTSSPAMVPAAMVAFRWASLKYAGTVTTARWMSVRPRRAWAMRFISPSTAALISSGARSLTFPSSSNSISGCLSSPSTKINGRRLLSFWTASSVIFCPKIRFTSKKVFRTFFAAWTLARSPTRRSPVSR
mmetsp:Transcript_33364/g.53785  ORF Transcript_33364/g.53785 Transcript_33364/m.53785 type:complete len:218 (+) Transcript_33364:1077-1730(+)